MIIRKLLLITFTFIGFSNQSHAMTLEQCKYTVSSNAPDVWITIGSQRISGRMKKVSFCQPYTDSIRFEFPGDHAVRIERSQIQGDIAISVYKFSEQEYSVVLVNDVGQGSHLHFDF